MNDENISAPVWVYPKAGGVQLYPKMSKGELTIINGVIALTLDDRTRVLERGIQELEKVTRWSSIMTLFFNDMKVQIDFRQPLKWQWRLLGPLVVLNKGWKQQLINEKPFEDYFKSIGVLK